MIEQKAIKRIRGRLCYDINIAAALPGVIVTICRVTIDPDTKIAKQWGADSLGEALGLLPTWLAELEDRAKQIANEGRHDEAKSA